MAELPKQIWLLLYTHSGGDANIQSEWYPNEALAMRRVKTLEKLGKACVESIQQSYHYPESTYLYELPVLVKLDPSKPRSAQAAERLYRHNHTFLR